MTAIVMCLLFCVLTTGRGLKIFPSDIVSRFSPRKIDDGVRVVCMCFMSISVPEKKKSTTGIDDEGTGNKKKVFRFRLVFISCLVGKSTTAVVFCVGYFVESCLAVMANG